MAIFIDETVSNNSEDNGSCSRNQLLWLNNRCELLLSRILNLSHYSWSLSPLSGGAPVAVGKDEKDKDSLVPSSDVSGSDSDDSHTGTSMSNHIYIIKLKAKRKGSLSSSSSSASSAATSSSSPSTSSSTTTSTSVSGNNRKLFLRLYGKSTSAMVDRRAESRYSVMISEKGLGPKILLYFNNGRIEEYVQDAVTLSTGKEMKDNMEQIAKQLRKLHEIPTQTIMGKANGASNQPSIIWDRMRQWIRLLDKLLAGHAENESNSSSNRRVTDYRPRRVQKTTRHPLEEIVTVPELEVFVNRLEKEIETKQRFFAQQISLTHGDLQYGNVMKNPLDSSILFVDFEYACLNYQSYDIANHFFEYTCHYKDDDYIINFDDFPTFTERARFYRFYSKEFDDPADDSRLVQYDGQVMAMLKISHLFWAIWGFIMAVQPTSPTFPYLSYAKDRFDFFLQHQ